MTMCCVTHEMGFARKVSHRVIFMDQGRIVEDCSRDDFFNRSEERSQRAKDFLSKILALKSTTTAAATTGPAKGPRPASSNPATNLKPFFHNFFSSTKFNFSIFKLSE